VPSIFTEPITAVPGLVALEIDPEAAAGKYRDRIVGPMRAVLPEAVVKSIEEQLSGACTTEIAAFDEFTALLAEEPVGVERLLELVAGEVREAQHAE